MPEWVVVEDKAGVALRLLKEMVLAARAADSVDVRLHLVYANTERDLQNELDDLDRRLLDDFVLIHIHPNEVFVDRGPVLLDAARQEVLLHVANTADTLWPTIASICRGKRVKLALDLELGIEEGHHPTAPEPFRVERLFRVLADAEIAEVFFASAWPALSWERELGLKVIAEQASQKVFVIPQASLAATKYGDPDQWRLRVSSRMAQPGKCDRLPGAVERLLFAYDCDPHFMDQRYTALLDALAVMDGGAVVAGDWRKYTGNQPHPSPVKEALCGLSDSGQMAGRWWTASSFMLTVLVAVSAARERGAGGIVAWPWSDPTHAIDAVAVLNDGMTYGAVLPSRSVTGALAAVLDDLLCWPNADTPLIGLREVKCDTEAGGFFSVSMYFRLDPTMARAGLPRTPIIPGWLTGGSGMLRALFALRQSFQRHFEMTVSASPFGATKEMVLCVKIPSIKPEQV